MLNLKHQQNEFLLFDISGHFSTKQEDFEDIADRVKCRIGDFTCDHPAFVEECQGFIVRDRAGYGDQQRQGGRYENEKSC